MAPFPFLLTAVFLGTGSFFPNSFTETCSPPLLPKAIYEIVIEIFLDEVFMVEKPPITEKIRLAARTIGNDVITLLLQLRCHLVTLILTHFGSLIVSGQSNTTVVIIFPNLC